MTWSGEEEEELLPSTSKAALRAKPCCCLSGPRSPNCGKQTGIPPRMALGGLKIALFETTRSSLPLREVQEVTCAPWR